MFTGMGRWLWTNYC